MTPKCPYCSTELPGSPPGQPVSGAKVCQRCGKSFEVYLVEPPYQALVPQLRDTPATGTTAPVQASPPVLQSAGQAPVIATPPTLPPPIPPPTAPVPLQHLPPAYLEAVQRGQVPPGVQAPIDLSQLPPVSESACVNHPGNQAMARCNNCARAICNLCLTPVEGKNFCPQCFELLRARGALESSQRAFNTPSVALGLSIATILLGWAYCLGFILGPLSIYFALRSLSEIERRPELPGRKKAIAAIVITAIGLVVTLIFVALIIIGTLMQPP